MGKRIIDDGGAEHDRPGSIGDNYRLVEIQIRFDFALARLFNVFWLEATRLVG